MQAPIQSKPVPDQVINELAAFNPFDLKEFIPLPEGCTELQFSAELAPDGGSLPQGMICTSDGILTGIPAKGTRGNYAVVVTVSNDAGSIQVQFNLLIKASVAGSIDSEYLETLKKQVWDAIHQKLPIPDLSDLHGQPLSSADVFYLLERWGVLTIWDAFNLDVPTDKQLLDLEGASPHYNIYDRGSCLIGVPKDLFSHERTLEDGLKTARAMAKEVFNRSWTVELIGLHKLTRAAWVELQHLGDQHEKRLEIINYNPTPNDIKVYKEESLSMGITPRLEI